MKKKARIMLFQEEEHGRGVESIFRFEDSTDLYKATVKRNMRWGSVFKWSETNGWLHLVGTESFSDNQTIEDLMWLATKFHYAMKGDE